ncbi:MAG: glycosyltransferase [Spirochaetia bacterium]|nr:glycosyltransferase [Spirochaetia bacterium]
MNKCVDSILAQTFTDFECILVDDGSPDSCGKICDEYAQKDSRVKVIHQENHGVNAARNSGLDMASGAWIVFVDGDDWIEGDLLEKALSADRHGADIVQWDFDVCYDENINEKKYLKHDGIKEGELKFSRNEPLAWWNGMCWMRMYSFEMLKKIGLRFPEDISNNGDTYFSYMALAAGRKVWCMADKLYHYRQRSGSIINNIRRKNIYTKTEVCRRIETDISKIGQLDRFYSTILQYKMEIKNWFIKHEPLDFNTWRNMFPEANWQAVRFYHGKKKIKYLMIILHMDMLVNKLVKIGK